MEVGATANLPGPDIKERTIGMINEFRAWLAVDGKQEEVWEVTAAMQQIFRDIDKQTNLPFSDVEEVNVQDRGGHFPRNGLRVANSGKEQRPEVSSFSESGSDSKEFHSENLGPQRRKKNRKKGRVDHGRVPSWMTDEMAWREEQRRYHQGVLHALGRMAAVMEGSARMNRSVKPLPFEINGVQSFESFIREFEDYARDRVGNDPNRWLVELKAHLKGSIQHTYEKCYKQGVKYRQVIERLKEWVYNQKSETLEDKRAQFYSATMKADETLCDFAMRLETVFRDAFPDESESDRTLWKRFMGGIPKAAQDRVKLRMGVMRLDEGRRGEPEWRDLLKALLDESFVVGPQHDERKNERYREEPVQVWTMPGVEAFENFREDRGYGDFRRERKGRDGREKQADYHRGTNGRGGNSRGTFRDPREVRRTTGGNYENDQGERREGPPTSGRVRCFNCRKRGHTRQQCRRLRGVCLLCDSEDHWVTECPRRRELARPAAAPPGVRAQPPQPCHLCGDMGHILNECPELQFSREKVGERRRGQLTAVQSANVAGGGSQQAGIMVQPNVTYGGPGYGIMGPSQGSAVGATSEGFQMTGVYQAPLN